MGGAAAAEVTEVAQEGTPKEHLPQAQPPSGSDTGPEPCVAEEGVAKPAPEADNAEPMQVTPAEGLEGGDEPPPEKELPQAPISGKEMDSVPEAEVDSADNAEPMQVTPAEGLEGGDEPPPEKELPQAPISGKEMDSVPEAEVDSADNAEPMQAIPAEGPEGAQKGGKEPERAEGGAIEVDPLPDVQRGQETGPRATTEGLVSIKVTKGAREEPPKEEPPRASPSGGDKGPGPCVAVGGEMERSPEVAPGSAVTAEPGPVTATEGGEGPERVDPFPPRTEDRPETVPRPSKEGCTPGT
ncbi:UNVERIFIED_CONTAM: hypothetical protein FKN15_067538 [Acipenser sinensis]